jgi:hypothetical protein
VRRMSYGVAVGDGASAARKAMPLTFHHAD